MRRTLSKAKIGQTHFQISVDLASDNECLSSEGGKKNSLTSIDYDRLSPTIPRKYDSEKKKIRKSSHRPMDLKTKLFEKRRAIMAEMFQTEQSYVAALKTLTKISYELYRIGWDTARLEKLFNQIPEIWILHEHLKTSLFNRLEDYENDDTIGDIFIRVNRQTHLIDAYLTFAWFHDVHRQEIEIIQDDMEFLQIVEKILKDHRNRLGFRDLLIQPIQRIPRYELYLKDLLESTPVDHLDSLLIPKALEELHILAERVDAAQNGELYTPINLLLLAPIFQEIELPTSHIINDIRNRHIDIPNKRRQRKEKTESSVKSTFQLLTSKWHQLINSGSSSGTSIMTDSKIDSSSPSKNDDSSLLHLDDKQEMSNVIDKTLQEVYHSLFDGPLKLIPSTSKLPRQSIDPAESIRQCCYGDTFGTRNIAALYYIFGAGREYLRHDWITFTLDIDSATINNSLSDNERSFIHKDVLLFTFNDQLLFASYSEDNIQLPSPAQQHLFNQSTYSSDMSTNDDNNTYNDNNNNNNNINNNNNNNLNLPDDKSNFEGDIETDLVDRSKSVPASGMTPTVVFSEWKKLYDEGKYFIIDSDTQEKFELCSRNLKILFVLSIDRLHSVKDGCCNLSMEKCEKQTNIKMKNNTSEITNYLDVMNDKHPINAYNEYMIKNGTNLASPHLNLTNSLNVISGDKNNKLSSSSAACLVSFLTHQYYSPKQQKEQQHPAIVEIHCDQKFRLKFIFSSIEKRQNWENSFNQATNLCRQINLTYLHSPTNVFQLINNISSPNTVEKNNVESSADYLRSCNLLPPPPPSSFEIWKLERYRRNSLLFSSSTTTSTLMNSSNQSESTSILSSRRRKSYNKRKGASFNQIPFPPRLSFDHEDHKISSGKLRRQSSGHPIASNGKHLTDAFQQIMGRNLSSRSLVTSRRSFRKSDNDKPDLSGLSSSSFTRLSPDENQIFQSRSSSVFSNTSIHFPSSNIIGCHSQSSLTTSSNRLSDGKKTDKTKIEKPEEKLKNDFVDSCKSFAYDAQDIILTIKEGSGGCVRSSLYNCNDKRISTSSKSSFSESSSFRDRLTRTNSKKSKILHSDHRDWLSYSNNFSCTLSKDADVVHSCVTLADFQIMLCTKIVKSNEEDPTKLIDHLSLPIISYNMKPLSKNLNDKNCTKNKLPSSNSTELSSHIHLWYAMSNGEVIILAVEWQKFLRKQSKKNDTSKSKNLAVGIYNLMKKSQKRHNSGDNHHHSPQNNSPTSINLPSSRYVTKQDHIHPHHYYHQHHYQQQQEQQRQQTQFPQMSPHSPTPISNTGSSFINRETAIQRKIVIPSIKSMNGKNEKTKKSVVHPLHIEQYEDVVYIVYTDGTIRLILNENNEWNRLKSSSDESTKSNNNVPLKRFFTDQKDNYSSLTKLLNTVVTLNIFSENDNDELHSTATSADVSNFETESTNSNDFDELEIYNVCLIPYSDEKHSLARTMTIGSSRSSLTIANSSTQISIWAGISGGIMIWKQRGDLLNRLPRFEGSFYDNIRLSEQYNYEEIYSESSSSSSAATDLDSVFSREIKIRANKRDVTFIWIPDTNGKVVCIEMAHHEGANDRHVWVCAKDASCDMYLYDKESLNCLKSINLQSIIRSCLSNFHQIILAYKMRQVYVTKLLTMDLPKTTHNEEAQILIIGTSIGLILLLNYATGTIRGLEQGHSSKVALLQKYGKYSFLSAGIGWEDFRASYYNNGENDRISHILLWRLSE